MKIYLKIFLFLIMVSCQENKKVKAGFTSPLESETKSSDIGTNFSSDTQSKTTLSKEEFIDFFPKQIDNYKLKGVSVFMSSTLASGLYIQDNDYNTSMTYSLEDGNRKNSAVIRNFEDAFALEGKGPVGTEYIYKVREGYKTIAFLQPDIKRNEIRFVYDNRFRISLEGTADVQTLWSYIQKEDLQKLDNY